MRAISAIFFLCFGLVAGGAEPQHCGAIDNEVLASVYNNDEFRDYICVDDEKCSIAKFAEQIDVLNTNLNKSNSRGKHCAFFVTPVKKYKQYPTLVFVEVDGAFRQVLSDYENGLSIASKKTHGMHDLLSQTHPTADTLVKILYSWNGHNYVAGKTQCFKVKARNKDRSPALVPQACLQYGHCCV